jgi:KUP system potassium uptake protein
MATAAHTAGATGFPAAQPTRHSLHVLMLGASGGSFDMMATSLFLGGQKLIGTSEAPRMALWRERPFAFMMRASESAMEFFKLPTNRVVELGSQLRT